MRIPFRQGVIRHQQDTQGNQTFLLEQDGGIDLITINGPTIITFAHRDRNYVFTETRNVPLAWTGPFQTGMDYWLYWDIDLKTGIRTFGHTSIQPTVGSTEPDDGIADQHWFDTTTNTMMVFNGASYKPRLRVFAAKYEDGTVIKSYNGSNVYVASQASMHQAGVGGALMFDDADMPLKRGDGTFITTADSISSGLPTSSNIKLEALTFEARASTNIAAFHVVYLNAFDSVLPASPFTINSVPYGVIQEDAYTGELVNITTDGIIVNPNWDWTEAGAELYIDANGAITTTKHPNMLPIGYVISPSEVLIKSGGVTHITMEGGVTGESVEVLDDLSDVDTSDVEHGMVLTYFDGIDGMPGNWYPAPGGGGSVEMLGDLSDVSRSTQYANDGDLLVFNEGDGVETFPEWTAMNPAQLKLHTVLDDNNDVFNQTTTDGYNWFVGDYTLPGGLQIWNTTVLGRTVIRINATDATDRAVDFSEFNDTDKFYIAVNGYVYPSTYVIDATDNVSLGEVVIQDVGFIVNDGDYVNLIPEYMNPTIEPKDGEVLTYNGRVWTPANPTSYTGFAPLPENVGIIDIVGPKTWYTVQMDRDLVIQASLYPDATVVHEAILEVVPNGFNITWPDNTIGDTMLITGEINVFKISIRPPVPHSDPAKSIPSTVFVERAFFPPAGSGGGEIFV